MSEQPTAFNLHQAIFDKVNDLGLKAAAIYFGRTESTMRKWQGGTMQPDLQAAQRVLDEAIAAGLNVAAFSEPPEQGQTIPDASPKFEETITRKSEPAPHPVEPVAVLEKARKFSILCPTNRDFNYAVMLSILGQWKATLPEEVRKLLGNLDIEPDTNVHFSRNRLATRFLESGAEWSFWMDSDIIAPIGNPAWFKRRTHTTHGDNWFATSALEKLTSRGKSIVSAVYCERNPSRKIVIQPGLEPQTEAHKDLAEQIRKGPREQVTEVQWCGFGCVAVHRQVFLDILEKVEGVKSESKDIPHEFFTQKSSGYEGEDQAFCKRAQEAGHRIYLDLSVHCGHLGKCAYLP